MAEKRTKADKQQRRDEQLDKKAEGRPEEETSKKEVHKDFSRAA